MEASLIPKECVMWFYSVVQQEQGSSISSSTLFCKNPHIVFLKLAYAYLQCRDVVSLLTKIQLENYCLEWRTRIKYLVIDCKLLTTLFH